MKIILVIVALFATLALRAQNPKYSTAWFGPNANPVPEFTDASIPANTTLSLMADYYYGYGDETKNGYFKIEIPLIPERVSIKLWSTVLENYTVSPEISALRGMHNGNTSGSANGDIYVQTRISLLNENENSPAIVLNTTLKTASGTNFLERRYFDTPGYYFDVEFGKSIHTKSKFINEMRAVADFGFMCWETTNSTQDDAPMYGGKIIIGNQHWTLESSLSGYWGWIHTNARINPSLDYGDAPMVIASKFSIITKEISSFFQYQYGIKDFPYQQVRIGVSIPIAKLTPTFK